MPKSYVSNEKKELVRKRAGNICEYCRAIGDYAFHPFSVDHVIPVSEGGTHALNNLALACQHCNNCKYNKRSGIDPLNQTEADLYHPRKDSWSDHFIWNEYQSSIIGITPKGRATVFSLKMNREEAVNLRKALGAFGVHPPDWE